MSSYVENFKGKVDFPKPFQRTGKFPLDRTDLFESYADAVLYAKGDRTNPDSRGLCGTSYVGQIITVYENDVVTVYKINADRSISEVGSSCIEVIKGELAAGEVTTTVNTPIGCEIMAVHLCDQMTGEILYTDTICGVNEVTVAVAEAYINNIDISVSCRVK